MISLSSVLRVQQRSSLSMIAFVLFKSNFGSGKSRPRTVSGTRRGVIWIHQALPDNNEFRRWQHAQYFLQSANGASIEMAEHQSRIVVQSPHRSGR
jgi:hypothetical protein